MRVLLSGASGFLGRHLLVRLRTHNIECVCISRRPDRSRELFGDPMVTWVSADSLFKSEQSSAISAIIHAATQYDRVASPSEIVECNLHLCERLIRFADEHGIGKFINIDTFYAFSENVDDNTQSSAYVDTKIQARKALSHYQRKINIINLYISHMYGPGDSPLKFVPNVLRQLREGKPITIKNPREIRDFIFVDDVVRAIEACLIALPSLPALHESSVISGKTCSILELVHLAREITQSQSSVTSINESPSLRRLWAFGNARLLNSIGWIPKVPIEEGIKRCIGDYEGDRDVRSV